MKNKNQPISPTMYTRYGTGENDYKPLNDGQKTGYEVKFGGLTKREYFALHLMSGLISNADRHSQARDCQSWNYEHLSQISINAADQLLKELENDSN